MAISYYNHVAIKGIAAVVPKTKWSISLDDFDNETEFKLTTKTTGILSRRIIKPGKTIADLNLVAVQKLLNELNWDAEQIDILINVTQSPDYILPSTACVLHGKLNLRPDVICYDVNLGCSGFVYGLQLIHQYLEFGPFKKALLVCGDKSSLMLKKENKASFPLFGDGGAVVALEKSNTATPAMFKLFTNGKKYESIIIKEGATRVPANKMVSDFKNNYGVYHLDLNGAEVFNFSTVTVVNSLNSFLQELAIDRNSLNVVFHQANKLILETMRKKLGIKEDKFFYSLPDFGNTSSASIPLTIITNKEKLSKENRTLLSGFGVGLSWANGLIDIRNTLLFDLIEYDAD